MARLYPFRALRYDTNRVNMADVVTQPYDKISPEMQAAYYARSPYNLIRIVLGKREPTDTDTENVYTRAAATYHAWRDEGILREEREPALYGYSQTYTVPGTAAVGETPEVRERRGFIALGHLYDYADHVVYRHEQTFPKHKSDRLALFKALRAYPEQIYMLYSDPTFTAEHLLFDAPNGETRPADLEITDEYNVLHRVWKLTDTTLIGRILENMSDKKLIIADGHHRYETSVAYMHERAQELGLEVGAPRLDSETWDPTAFDDNDESPSNLADAHHHNPLTPPFPEAAMMMTFVNMDAPGITILPTHRVLSGIERFSSADFLTKASAYFTVEALPGLTTGPDLTAHLAETPSNEHADPFIAVTQDGNFLLTPRPEAIAPLLESQPPRQRQLGVVQLHTVVLDHLLGLDQATVTRLGNVKYLREATEAVSLVHSGEADLAFLIKPITLTQLRDISLSGDVMPQKSTDFYPKLLSGLAIYALD